MHERTTRKSVQFLHPFSLASIDELLPAGTYIVETLEEAIEGLSFIAFRRVSTKIITAAKGCRQVVTIDPHDLEAAQAKGGDRHFHWLRGSLIRKMTARSSTVDHCTGLIFY